MRNLNQECVETEKIEIWEEEEDKNFSAGFNY